jgi:hypothetical protein
MQDKGHYGSIEEFWGWDVKILPCAIYPKYSPTTI